MKGFGFKGVRFGSSGGSGIAFDESAQALFDFVGDVPTVFKPHINSLIVGLKAKGYWDNAGFWMIISVPTLTWQNTLVEIKSLTVNSIFAAQTVPPFTANGQYPSVQKGMIAGASYLSTDFIPSVNLTLNDSTEVFVTYEDETTPAVIFNYGALNVITQATLFITNISSVADHSAYAFDANGRTQGANPNGAKGVYLNTRRASNDAEIALNGSVLGTNVNSSGSLSTRNVFLNTYNNNGAPHASKRNQSSMIVFGGLGEAVAAIDRVSTSALFENYQINTQMIDGQQTKQVVIDGNSHAVYEASAIPRKIAYDLIMTDWEHTSFAVTSQTTAQMQADYAAQVAPKFNGGYTKNILPVIEITNDYFFGATKEVAFQNYKDYCITAQATGYLVVSVPVILRNFTGNTGGRSETQFNLDQDWINTKLAAEFADFSDVLVPTHPNAWTPRSLYASDAAYNAAVSAILTGGAYSDNMTHLTEANYYVWADQIKTALLTL